ncbi:hypothetical protein FQR65_LT10468 [Abscondita terminalis]|nr:hypothetical protein FQR65_LT10468 [Abscondita terminalis]
MSHCIRKIGNKTKADIILNKYFVSSLRSSFVEVGEHNICMPEYYKVYYQRIRDVEIREDDVFLAGFTKSGTRWAQEMVWLIVNNFDYQRAKTIELAKRAPLLELNALFKPDFDVGFDKDNVKLFKSMESPRCVRTHLEWNLLPADIVNGLKKPKIIVTLRRPEDVCVSYFHHSKEHEKYSGSFENFCETFLAGRVPHGPFWSQVFSYWNKKENDNILFIKYSDMKTDLTSVIKEVSKFLDKSMSTDEMVTLSEHLTFDSLKKNKCFNNEHLLDANSKCNPWIRRGVLDGYKSSMSAELQQKFQLWTEQHLKGTDLIIN